ncbi:MAG: hypothetical protein HY390_08235, partial [Deltaproteobacteria bacterium]|nr:hypothetical protein [Deltaproteobacteria bacterium]
MQRHETVGRCCVLRAKIKWVMFFAFCSGLLLPSVDLSAKPPSIEDLLRQVKGHLDQIDLSDLSSVSQQDFDEIRNIARLREVFIRSWAHREGILLSKTKAQNVWEALMTFHTYCKEHELPELANQIAEASLKLLSVKSLVFQTLILLKENAPLFRDVHIRGLLSKNDVVTRFYRNGDIDYIGYFKFLKQLASKYDPKITTVENEFYERAKLQVQDYQTYSDIWNELIRATSIENGQYQQGLQELIRHGHFGLKAQLGYVLMKSTSARMVRSMVHFYFMRAFTEVYVGLYHGETDRLKDYLGMLFNDHMMHANFITFSVVADRVRHVFHQSSVFHRWGLQHPLLARTWLDAAPLFSGMMVSDAIFNMISHPRFKEVGWLVRQGEMTEALFLLKDLVHEVWFRKSFLVRALASTAIFTGYELAFHSTMTRSARSLTTWFSRWTSHPFVTRASLNPGVSFLVGVSAFITHDLLMEKLEPTLNAWDWQDRIAGAEVLLKKSLHVFEGQHELFRQAQKELGLEDISLEVFKDLAFHRMLISFLSEERAKSSENIFFLKQLEQDVYELKLLEITRDLHTKELLQRRVEKGCQNFLAMCAVWDRSFELSLYFELLEEAYEGAREALFYPLYQRIWNYEQEFEMRKAEMMPFYTAETQRLQSRGDVDLAFVTASRAQSALISLKKNIFSQEARKVHQFLDELSSMDCQAQDLSNFRAVQALLSKKNDERSGMDMEVFDYQWFSLFTQQLHFYLTLYEGTDFRILKQDLEMMAVRTLLSFQLKRFQIERTKREGLLGWQQDELTPNETQELQELLKALDPTRK